MQFFYLFKMCSKLRKCTIVCNMHIACAISSKHWRQRIRRREIANVISKSRFDSVLSIFFSLLSIRTVHCFVTIYLSFEIINQPWEVIYGNILTGFSCGWFGTNMNVANMSMTTYHWNAIYAHVKANQIIFSFWIGFPHAFQLRFCYFYLDSKPVETICPSVCIPNYYSGVVNLANIFENSIIFIPYFFCSTASTSTCPISRCSSCPIQLEELWS